MLCRGELEKQEREELLVSSESSGKNARDRMGYATQSLQQSTDKLARATATAIEVRCSFCILVLFGRWLILRPCGLQTEALGGDILSDLQQQRETLLSSRGNLQLADGQVPYKPMSSCEKCKLTAVTDLFFSKFTANYAEADDYQ